MNGFTRTNLLSIGTWLLVIGSPIFGIVALLRPIPDIPHIPTYSDAQLASPAIASFAELAVQQHLYKAKQSLITTTFGTTKQLGSPELAAMMPPSVHTVSIMSVKEGSWAVHVASSEHNTLRTWQVLVTETPQGLTLAALPALVTPFVPHRPSDPLIEQLKPANLSDPLTHTVAMSLQAYLTGTPELSRYVSSSTNILPLDPPPFANINVERIAVTQQDNTIIVLAEVVATRADGLAIPMHYPMALTQESGKAVVLGFLKALP